MLKSENFTKLGLLTHASNYIYVVANAIIIIVFVVLCIIFYRNSNITSVSITLYADDSIWVAEEPLAWHSSDASNSDGYKVYRR